MFDTLGQIWDLIPVRISHPFMHIVTLPLPVACRNLTPSLSSHHSPPPPVPFTSLYSTLSCPPPSLPVPTSNSLPWTNPGGLSHRWVWLGAYLCMALPEVLSPIPSPPSFVVIHLWVTEISINAALLSLGKKFKYVSLWVTPEGA